MERKLATVLFVDLVDSTALVAGADPEVVRRRVHAVLRAASRIASTPRRHRREVRRRRGHGRFRRSRRRTRTTPSARSAPASRSSTPCTSSSSRRGSASSRARSSPRTATRRSPPARPSTLAARLQQAAEPGEILLGPGAHRLTLGRVEVEDLGPVELRGLAEPVWAWRARRHARAPAASARRVSAPLVGREAELDLLAEHLRRARCATAAPTCSRSTASRASARAGSRASSSTGSRARRCSPGRACRTARASPTGRSPRWSRRRPGSPTTTRSRRRSRSCARPARTRRSPTCSGSRPGVLEAVQGERSQQEIAWAAREWAERLAQRAAARARLRGHPLGRGAAARADRAPRRPGCARRRC